MKSLSISTKYIFLLLGSLLGACAHAPTCARRSNDERDREASCRQPIPLELRAKRVSAGLAIGFAHVPALSVSERKHMSQLTACFGASLLGSGDGCWKEWQAARASGLAERYNMREGEYSIPEALDRAAKMPLGPKRTHELLMALHTAHDAVAEVEAYLRARLTENEYQALQEHTVFLAPRPAIAAYLADPGQLATVASDVEQALVCDAQDLADGCREGQPYDPNAPIPTDR